MRKLVQRCAGVMSLAIAVMQALTLYTQAVLPDYYYVAAGETLELHAPVPIETSQTKNSMPAEVYAAAGNHYSLNLTLPGGIPIKQVQVQVVDREMVIPGGNAFGIKMFTEGVIVVGLSDVSNGAARSPAKTAGVRVGDIILTMDGHSVQSNEDVGKIVSSSNGEPLAVELERGGVRQTLQLCPTKSEDGVYRAGIWVRDSSAGIGTMTYYEPSTGVFAGLGHAICDIDTGSIMPLHSGEIVDVSILGVNKGASGAPGELRGAFLPKTTGELRVNSQSGIFGVGAMPDRKTDPVPLAMRHEVEEGPAIIRCTLADNQVEEFAVEIEKVSIGQDNPTKNMVLHVTDPQLLEKTGGIVQGMSGSPILQNNKLVGAVTHVFVNDPTRGYGIFAENMSEMSKNVETTRTQL